MSKTETDSARSRLALFIGFAVAIVVLVAGGLVLRAYGPGNMGNGFMAGGGVALVAVAIAGVRVMAGRGSTFERAYTQMGDERDDLVLTRALAVVGITSIPLVAAGLVVVAIGLDPIITIGVLFAVLLAVAALSFVVINRRM